MTAVSFPGAAHRNVSARAIRIGIAGASLLLFLLLLAGVAHNTRAAVDLGGALATIQPSDLIPGADRFGAVEGAPPRAQALEGSTLRGYVFLNTDVVGAVGYSGKPIHLLIGLDNEGTIAGVVLHEHHEPIVLIGIPERKVKGFIAGYVGRNVREFLEERDADDRSLDIIAGATVTIWLNSRLVCICGRLPGTSGGWIMDIRGFQVWLSAARGLTRGQRREALAVLSGRSEGEASKAAIELGVDEARRCPHCAREGAVSRGMARGLRRYQCKGCGRTFNALSGTPLSGLHHKERWLSFGASLAKGETVKASAARCDVAVSTAFRWRHRFLAAARSDSEVLKGIVEADETYVLESRKGARGLGRKARRRGGKAKKRGLSREQVPVLMAADRSGTTVSAVLPRVDAAALAAALDPVVAKDALLVSDGGASYPPCAAALGVSHEALNRSMGERVRGDLHVQTVNSRHSRLKDFLRPRRGIATRYLDNYLSWFHLVGLAPGANDRACLAAAITR